MVWHPKTQVNLIYFLFIFQTTFCIHVFPDTRFSSNLGWNTKKNGAIIWGRNNFLSIISSNPWLLLLQKWWWTDLLLTLNFHRKKSCCSWWLTSFKKKLPIDSSIYLKKLRTVTGMFIKKIIQSCSSNCQCWEKPREGFQKPTQSAWRIRNHAFALYTVNFMKVSMKAIPRNKHRVIGGLSDK